jgi:putative tryptophan/tyrosine transport system substrate-binding protein
MQFGQLKRREFISLLGSAAAWPLAARAQQAAMPVIGFLHPQSPEGYVEPMRAFRQGLKDVGYVEGENIAIEYRWADNQSDRLPALAADLVRRRVAVIAALGGHLSALAAKAATTTIPIVFNVGADPVRTGLVASLARPGGNLTGVNLFSNELAAKRLELLRELVGHLARVAVLVNPASVGSTELILRDVETASRSMGLQSRILNADTPREIDAAFASIGHERPDALFVALTPFFIVRRVQMLQLAAFHRIPASYGLRDLADGGGLMSYGASLSEAYRQVGGYSGRILKGTKPTDLPVLQSTKLELVINHQTARMLGLTVPPSLLATADEVIE